jgi:galactokinase
MPREALLEAANAALERLGAAPSDVRRWFVPGRLEVLGKHTDYAGGRSLLCAVERGICFAVAPRADGRLRVVDAARRREAAFTIAPDLAPAPGHWSNYPITVARRLARDFGGALAGAEIAFASDLPSAAGMSSSSALVVGFFTALADVNDLERRPEYVANIKATEDLAGYLGTVENGRSFGSLEGDRGVGTAGGSEDHTAILCCRAEQLSQYAFCPIRHERSVRLPPAWVFAVAVSGVAADKSAAARDAYNRASRAADVMLQAWRAATGRTDPCLAEAVAASPDAPERMRKAVRDAAAAPYPPRALLDRLEQFLAESTEIIPEAGDCLARGDVEGIGLLVDRSQRMAERLLGNQVPETVALARSARGLGPRHHQGPPPGPGGPHVLRLVPSARLCNLNRWKRATSPGVDTPCSQLHVLKSLGWSCGRTLTDGRLTPSQYLGLPEGDPAGGHHAC